MIKKVTAAALTFAMCFLLASCGKNADKQPDCEHQYGDWVVKTKATCEEEGQQERSCSICGQAEVQQIPMTEHTYKKDNNLCKKCYYVDFDPNAEVAELGCFSQYWYTTNNPTANEVWDVKIWGDLVYRGAGDYNKNSGVTPILAFNKQTQRWVKLSDTEDQAIQRFVEIDGTLYAPGIDPAGSWDLGNYYVLDAEQWKQVRNLPGGLHNFDMIAFDGKIFAGLETETPADTVAVSQDKGESFTFVPLYRDGVLFDTSGYEYSRTFAFVECKGSLYALIRFKKNNVTDYDAFIFRYADGKMEYQSVADSRLQGTSGRNLWQGKLEWKGTCYVTSTALNAITDFSKPETHKQIPMPNGGVVTDILLYNDELYVLSFVFKEDMSYSVVIYKSEAGEEGSFTEVTSFDYAGMPISFDFDGNHFYIGIGSSFADSSKAGMVLRVKPAA